MSKASPIWPASAAQEADRPRLAEARGSLRHDLALKGASGEPAGRGLSRLVFHMGVRLELGVQQGARAAGRARDEHCGAGGLHRRLEASRQGGQRNEREEGHHHGSFAGVLENGQHGAQTLQIYLFFYSSS